MAAAARPRKAPAKKAATAGPAAKKAAAKPRKKAAAPGKPGKPAAPAKPAAVAKAGKPSMPPAVPATPAPAAPAAIDGPSGQEAAPAPTAPPAPEPAAQGWIPMPTPSAQTPLFDPATGAWLPVDQHGPPAAPAPEDAKRGVGYVLWTILLWIDLVALAGAVLFAIYVGAVLLFAPESAAAEEMRESLTGGSKQGVVLNTLLNLLLFGIIPFLWVLGTRRAPVEGTKRFLHLHLQRGRDGEKSLAWTVLWGAVCAAAMLGTVAVLITAYTCATEPDCFTVADEEENPAIQGLLDNLTWPIAILVAVCAGVGEEVFFRGFLQRYVGVWGQAVLFGLAHSTGGYLPQILFAFGMAVAFGLLVKRGWSLWTLILAHALYDFVLLALALVAPELG